VQGVGFEPTNGKARLITVRSIRPLWHPCTVIVTGMVVNRRAYCMKVLELYHCEVIVK
jgi:hypothetical protein